MLLRNRNCYYIKTNDKLRFENFPLLKFSILQIFIGIGKINFTLKNYKTEKHRHKKWYKNEVKLFFQSITLNICI